METPAEAEYSEDRRRPRPDSAKPATDARVKTQTWRVLMVPGSYRKQWAHRGQLAEDQLMASLPENFGWTLRYMSALYGVPPCAVYAVVLEAEDAALKGDFAYFGERTDHREDCLRCVNYKKQQRLYRQIGGRTQRRREKRLRARREEASCSKSKE